MAALPPILNLHLLLGERNVVPVHTIKKYGGAEVNLNLFLTLAL